MLDYMLEDSPNKTIDTFFSIKNIPTLDKEDLDLTLETINLVLRSEIKEEQYSAPIRAYLQALMKTFGFKDIEKILPIYNSLSSGDVEWVKLLNTEVKRILEEGF